MSRYARVKIGGTHLTADGTEGATPCKVTVSNESAFASPYAAAAQVAADGTPHTQVVARGVRGVEFVVLVEQCPEAVLALVLAELNLALSSLSAVRVVATSLTDFDVMASPLTFDGGQVFTFESRSGGFARGVQFRFISTAPGE